VSLVGVKRSNLPCIFLGEVTIDLIFFDLWRGWIAMTEGIQLNSRLWNGCWTGNRLKDGLGALVLERESLACPRRWARLGQCDKERKMRRGQKFGK